jgi:hypothetical protein
MSGELRGEISVLTIRYMAAEMCVGRVEDQVHDLFRNLYLLIPAPTSRLVEARPMQLLAKTVAIAQTLYLANQNRRIA